MARFGRQPVRAGRAVSAVSHCEAASGGAHSQREGDGGGCRRTPWNLSTTPSIPFASLCPPTRFPTIEPRRQPADVQEERGRQAAGGRADTHVAGKVAPEAIRWQPTSTASTREQQSALRIEPDQGGGQSGGGGRVGRGEALRAALTAEQRQPIAERVPDRAVKSSGRS